MMLSRSPLDQIPGLGWRVNVRLVAGVQRGQGSVIFLGAQPPGAYLHWREAAWQASVLFTDYWAGLTPGV